MTQRKCSRPQRPRRGAVAVLVALLLIFIMGMVAFGVDIGYIVLVRAQLQNAADSAAMAAVPAMIDDVDAVYDAANLYAGKHWAGGQNVALETSDVEIGTWDSDAETFTPSGGSSGNAVRVTARRNAVPLFFGVVLGRQTFNAEASAVAMSNPRDICFVVDLSGSMNDDTEPAWVSDYLDGHYAGQGYGSVGSDLIQNVYTDFGFGTYPGTLEYWGSSLGVTSDSNAYANMTKNGGPLTLASIPVAYRIVSGDSEAQRKKKCYSWIMDKRLKLVVMPNAKPTINSTVTSSYNYWERYLDYVVYQKSVSGRGTIPSLVSSSYRVTGLNNPNGDSYPSISSSTPSGYLNKYGYRTYVNFMMDFGRDVLAGGTHPPLSTSSADCPWHTESVGDDSFSFPPREQPTHASRRSMIAAMQVVEEMNADIANLAVRDWVSIVTFDHLSSGGPVVAQALTGDYDDAKEVCTHFQAVGDNQSSTATESGLIKAHDHLTTAGRTNTGKVVVLLTDGVPNLYSSSNSTINSYMTAHSNDDYYGSGYAKNAPLMQSDILHAGGYYLYSVGLGLGTDYDFLDRMARMGNTANDDGETFRGSGNPTDYEAVLTSIFEQIIRSPKARLVK
jgi:Mg-chelatase subunit ChlD